MGEASKEVRSPLGSSSGDALPAAFEEQLQMWLHSNDFSDNTIILYEMSARRWAEYATPWKQGWGVRSIEWRRSLTEKAAKTQSVMVGAAKGFLTHLIEAELLEGKNALTTVKFRGLSDDSTKRRALTDDEVSRLLDQCDLETELGLRDYAVLSIMLYTALRVGAVAQFDLEDIEKQGEYTIVRYQGKGQRSKDRKKVLPDNVLLAVKTYLKKTGRKLEDTGALWTTPAGTRLSFHGIRKSIIRRLSACGIKDSAVTIHSLRHTAATKALESGNDVKAVQELLDHKSLATTDRYVHSRRKLKQAAELTINYDLEDADAGRKSKRAGKGANTRRKAD